MCEFLIYLQALGVFLLCIIAAEGLRRSNLFSLATSFQPTSIGAYQSSAGWWYGVVAHLETCDGDANYCCCHNSDTVVLEFRQYTRGSRRRRTIVNRKDHREEGDEAGGFYGGVRKLCGNDEISRWNNSGLLKYWNRSS